MNRTIEDIQKDIELLGIKGGYDIEQLLTPQDCRRLSYEIERLNNIINELEKYIDEDFKENYQLRDILNTYKHEVKILNKKLCDEKRKFYRNRRLFERIIDEVVLPIIDEDVLKEITNLTYKTLKEEILKEYDEDIKQN